MEDWMKQPSDLRRPSPGPGRQRGMTEVPLGSVEVPVGRPAQGNAARPVRPSGQGPRKPAPSGRRPSGGQRPPQRPGSTPPRRGQPTRKKKKPSFAGFVAANFAVILLLAGVITLLIEQPWKTAGLPASGSTASSTSGVQSTAQSGAGAGDETAAQPTGIGPVQQAQGLSLIHI